MAEFFISAPRLAEHQALSREEKLRAEALRDAVRALGRAEHVAVDDRYRLLLRKVNTLYEFVQEITRVSDHLDEEAWQLIRRIHKIMGDAAEAAGEAARFSFMG